MSLFSTLQQAKEWQARFEKSCRWQEPANKVAGTAMLNELIFMIPEGLKPFARKIVVSILDQDIVYFCQLGEFGPSQKLRSCVFFIFRLAALHIRCFCLPRVWSYQRTPSGSNAHTVSRRRSCELA